MEFYQGTLSLAFDIHGCLAYCKHCWIGNVKHKTMDADDVFFLFDEIRKEQATKSYYGMRLEYMAPDFREPHAGDDYKELYKRADERNACTLEAAKSFELLSLQRINEDPLYLPWIADRGIKRCQLKVFGLKEANDFFYGRYGAHEDLLRATELLLDHLIIPRFQVFLNKRGLKDLQGLFDLVDSLDLFSRVRALGEEFNLHCMTFSSDGRGFLNHALRIEKKDLHYLPDRLLQYSKKHFGSFSLKTESQRVQEILSQEERPVFSKDHWLWFYVTSDWSVYPNWMGIAPFFYLGNIKRDPWKVILDRYVSNEAPGLQRRSKSTSYELTRMHGDKKGERIFMDENEVLEYYRALALRRSYA